MKYYRTSSIKIQDYLEENGVVPKSYEGKTAIYREDQQLSLLLDRFYIYYVINKSIF